jgi:hypothetical protein
VLAVTRDECLEAHIRSQRGELGRRIKLVDIFEAVLEGVSQPIDCEILIALPRGENGMVEFG